MDEDEKNKLYPIFDCKICFLEVKVEEGITLDCDHRFCRVCIGAHIKTLIDSSLVSEEQLKCPA